MTESVDRWRVMRESISEALGQPAARGARTLQAALAPLGPITWELVFTDGSKAAAMWISRTGTARQACGRLRIAYRPLTAFSLPVPWLVRGDDATLEAIDNGRTVIRPLALDPGRACELAWIHWLGAQVEAVQEGLADKDRKELLRRPVRDALRLRWDASDSVVERTMNKISASEQVLGRQIVGALSAAGSDADMEQVIRDPHGHRTVLADVNAEFTGRLLEIFRICRDLADQIERVHR